MLNNITIKKLYPFALAEGEGVGTAYEYYSKRLLLSRWLANNEPPRSILIAGLPQKYGASMDFLLLAAELGTDLTIVDERIAALNRCRSALGEIQKTGELSHLNPRFLHTHDIMEMPEIDDYSDLALSSEVLQRLPEDDRLQYMTKTLQMAPKGGSFCT